MENGILDQVLPFSKAQYRRRNRFGSEDNNSILDMGTWRCLQDIHVRMNRWIWHPADRAGLEITQNFQ